MRIGIDIDDVLVKNTEYFLEHIKKENLSPEIHQKINDSLPDIMAGKVPEELKEILNKVYGKYNNVYEIMPNASQVVIKLKEKNKIIIATSRGENWIKGSEEVTRNYLKKNHIYYDEINFNVYDKAKFCVENKIDLFIDDSIKHAEAIQNKGVKVFLFDSIINKNINTKVPRVHSWLEIQNKVEEILS